MHSDLNSNALFDLHHSTSPSNKIYLRSTILETITTKLQIPYSLTRAISIFDPPPTIEHIRFERRNSVACKPRDSFNQPARVKNRLAISYRSDFTRAVNHGPYGGITLNKNRSGLVSLREDYVFYGMVWEIERPSVMLLSWFIRNRCKTRVYWRNKSHESVPMIRRAETWSSWRLRPETTLFISAINKLPYVG